MATATFPAPAPATPASAAPASPVTAAVPAPAAMSPADAEAKAWKDSKEAAERGKSGFGAEDFLNLFTTAKPIGGDYAVTKEISTPHVFYDVRRRTSTLAAAKVVVVQSPTGSSGTGSSACVVLCKANPDRQGARYFYWCGDDFLEGNLGGVDQRKRVQSAMSASGLPLVKQMEIERQLREAGGSMPQSTSEKDHFWKPFSADPHGGGCKHVRHALAHLVARPDGELGVLRELDAAYEAMLAETAKRSSALLTAEPASGAKPVDAATQAKLDLEQRFRAESPKMAKILDKAGPRKQHKLPVLILGQPGQGKTHDFRVLGKSGLYDGYFEYSCSSGQDEYHVLGGTREASVRDAAGVMHRSFPHVPSTIVRAIQSAAEGAKSGKVYALLLEELPSLKDDVWNIFKTMLNPFAGMYRLETTRVVGFDGAGQGIPEVIECPRSALSIFATGNVGENAQSYFGDAAAMNRFYCIYLDEDPKQICNAAQGVAAQCGMSADAVERIRRFMDAMVKMKRDGMVEALPNIRDFDDAIRLCDGDERNLQHHLSDFAYRWAGRDAFHVPNTDQIAVVRRCLSDTFKA